MRLPLLLLFLLSLPLSAQNAAYRSYINRYAPWAVEQMKEHGIPASITLAQGLLESNAGQSELARKANNHFGIKTGGTWRGPYVLKDDDRRGEKFRKYRSARESYEDHSQFLRTRPRYASLFRLKKTDYEGWARGLKKAGYATNPRYANLLIDLIERYDLAQYDHHLAQRAQEAGGCQKGGGGEDGGSRGKPAGRQAKRAVFRDSTAGRHFQEDSPRNACLRREAP